MLDFLGVSNGKFGDVSKLTEDELSNAKQKIGIEQELGQARRLAISCVAFCTFSLCCASIALPALLSASHSLQSDIQLDTDFCRVRLRDIWSEMVKQYPDEPALIIDSDDGSGDDVKRLVKRGATKGAWLFGRWMADAPAVHGAAAPRRMHAAPTVVATEPQAPIAPVPNNKNTVSGSADSGAYGGAAYGGAPVSNNKNTVAGSAADSGAYGGAAYGGAPVLNNKNTVAGSAADNGAYGGFGASHGAYGGAAAYGEATAQPPKADGYGLELSAQRAHAAANGGYDAQPIGGRRQAQPPAQKPPPPQSALAQRDEMCCCCQGAPGPQGDAGADGEPGTDGAAGKAGDDGRSGEVIAHDAPPKEPCIICPQGPPGPAGGQGPRGPTGPRGANGNSGIDGKRGENGMEGSPGPVGNIGPAGPQGPSGIPGRKFFTEGARGPPGKTGPKGPKGLPGCQGTQGITVQGPRGPPGEPGRAGKDGRRGQQGANGMPGDKGGAGQCFHCPTPRLAPGY